MAGSLQTPGLNKMADGIGTTANLELVAAIGAVEYATKPVAFNAAGGGVIAITGDVTITIPDTLPAPYEITHVYLRTIGDTLSQGYGVDIITGYAFQNGGDLIVKSYNIQASN